MISYALRFLAPIAAFVLFAAPHAAHAQAPGPIRTVGILGHVPAVSLEEGLRDLGWVEGKNIRFERRLTTDDKALARYAAELTRVPVDVIFAGNAAATRAARQATRVIPIITVSADPVKAGVASSLARPGENVTGFAITQLLGKRLEILAQALPTARRVAFLANPTNPNTPYGSEPGELYVRAVTYTDRVLKGTKPSDLPIEQAPKFELAINLKTAKALGLTIPPSLLLRADAVIQ